jgi:hypothetical protein
LLCRWRAPSSSTRGWKLYFLFFHAPETECIGTGNTPLREQIPLAPDVGLSEQVIAVSIGMADRERSHPALTAVWRSSPTFLESLSEIPKSICYRPRAENDRGKPQHW